MPLLFLWKAYRPYEAIQELLSSSLVLRLAFWPTIFAPGILLALNIDYGRFISVAFLSYLFCICNEAVTEVCNANARSSLRLFASCAMLSSY